MTQPLYPLLFRPVYKDYLWGGDRIIRTFDREEPPGTYAESWEVSDRPDGMSIVANGAWAGRSLHEVCGALGADLLGAGTQDAGGEPRFPLLIKLIDSRERLSVQVHPNDETAERYGGDAKTEVWYILDADPGAGVFAGLRSGVDEKVFRAAIEQQQCEDLLISVPVTKGDVVFTPGGRVHAIDAGCLILEIQQNSNTTYRIYDWGRVGPDGQARELHIEQALQVTQWHDDARAKVEPRRLGFLGKNELWEVLACPYFRLERLLLKEEWPTANDGRSFHVLFVAEGQVELEWNDQRETVAPGQAVLVPAALPSYVIKPGPEAQVLRVTVP